MANPLFKVGETNPYPNAGAPRKSIRTAAGMLTAFITRSISSQQLKKLFDKLTAKEQADFLLQSFPYIMAKKSNDVLNASDIDAAYNKLMDALNTNAKAS